jgi:hypothetical protein
MLAVGRRAVAGGSVEVAGSVVTRFRLAVTQPGRDITILCGETRLSAAHSSQLIRPGILAVLGGLGAIFGRNLAVIDRLGSVIRSLGGGRWRWRAIAGRLLILARRAVSCGPVEVTRCVVARSRLAITLFRLSVTGVRGQIAVAPFYVPLTRG